MGRWAGTETGDSGSPGPRRLVLVLVIASLVATMAGFGVTELPASATTNTYTVGTTGDSATPVADCATTTNNDCTLRDAIDAANTDNGGTDTILFSSGLPSPSTIVLDATNGPLVITDAGTLDITGPSASQMMVSGDNAVEVFDVETGATATVSGLTVEDGQAAPGSDGDGGAGGAGGGISSSGTLTLDNDTISGNASGNGGDVAFIGDGGDGGAGGGISSSGTLTLDNDTISGNDAGTGGTSGSGNPEDPAGDGGAGGGISSSGTLTLDNDTISGNDAGTGGTGADANGSNAGPSGNGGAGGGIFSSGTLTLDNATIAGNSAGAGGAGTTSGNGGVGGNGGTGGGIAGSGISTTLENDTISGNAAGAGGIGGIGPGDMQAPGTGGDGGNGGSGGSGGGISSSSTSMTVENDTISGNAAGAGGNGGSAPGTYAEGIGGKGGNGGAGGGISSSATSTTFEYDTISGNTAGAAGAAGSGSFIDGNGGSAGAGGDIGDAGKLSLAATIVANSDATGGDCDGFVGTDNGYDIDSDGTCGFGDGPGSVSDSTTLNVSLGPLQSNGGPTDTIALLAKSPAIGIIPNPTTGLCPRTDQRGVSNPSGANCDSGAFQTAPSPPPSAFTTAITAPGSTAVGNAWNDVATVTGNTTYGAPAGSVSFTLCSVVFPATSCTGGSAVGTVSSTSSGDVSSFTLPPGDAQSPGSPGTYCYNASYSASSGGFYTSLSAQSDTECFTVTAATATATITAVDGLDSKAGNGTTTLSVSPQHVGDLMTLAIKICSPTVSVSSVSGGGVTSWTKAVGPYTAYKDTELEIFTGVVSTKGSSTITVTFSASVRSVYVGLAAREFSGSAGTSTTWALDTGAGIANASSSTVTFPKLTPSTTGELYFGYAALANTGSAGTTPGFTYATTVDADLVTYDTGVMGTVQPSARQSPAGVSGAVAILVGATGPVPAPSPPTAVAAGSLDSKAGTDTTTLAVSPQHVGDLLALAVKVASSTVTASSVTGGGVSTWKQVQGPSTAYSGMGLEIFTGVVSASGPSTITVAFAAAVHSIYVGLAAQEFSASTGTSTTWGTDTGAGISNASSSTVTFPKLTPTGTGEIYFGYAAVNNTAAAGTTTGFTYAKTVDADVVAYDTNVSAAVQPTAKQSPAGVSGGLAVLITFT